MAKLGQSFEWLVIRVDTLYKLLVVGAVVLAACIGLYIFKKGPDKAKEAGEKLATATQKVDKVRDKLLPEQKQQLKPAYDALAIAREAMQSKDYPKVLEACAKALQVSDKLWEDINGANNGSQATVVDIQGTVEVKKTASPDYVSLTRNMRLEPGDIIRSAGGAQAVVKYPDETTQLIGPDTIYIIRSIERTAAGGFRLDSLLERGRTEISRPPNSNGENQYQVNTNQGLGASPTPGARMGVAEGADGARVAVYKGNAEVTHDGKTTSLQEGNQVASAAPNAALVQSKIPRPPALLTPGDQQVFTAGPEESLEVIFSWTAPDGGGPVNFQLGTDAFMSRERQLTEQTVAAGAKLTIKLPRGTAAYFWRVREAPPAQPAAKKGTPSAPVPAGPIDDLSHPWSFIGAFKAIASVHAQSGPGSSTPQVALQLQCGLTGLSGDSMLVNCKTTPGLTMTIDSRECDVVDGKCEKFMQCTQAGKMAIAVRVFDNYGNDKTQTLHYLCAPQ